MTPKTRRILGYSRGHVGNKHDLTHHIVDLSPAMVCQKGGTTAIYVIEWNEEQDSDTRQSAGTRCDAPY